MAARIKEYDILEDDKSRRGGKPDGMDGVEESDKLEPIINDSWDVERRLSDPDLGPVQRDLDDFVDKKLNRS